MPASKHEHAVVIGGSIAGCLTAEILSRHFTTVTIVEKGDFDDKTSDRQGVPQEKHTHVLLLEGQRLMEEIFPGLTNDLIQAGAVGADLINDVRWFQYGLWKQCYASKLHSLFFSRRFLDNYLRGRIRRNPKIVVRSETAVADLLVSSANGRPAVAGVKISTSAGVDTLCGNLVIDASGRGSRTANWLTAAGLDETPRMLIETHLGYASRIYRRSPAHKDWRAVVIWPTPPEQKRIGLMLPIEGDRWMVSAGGWFDAFPKPNPDEFVEFMRTLPVPDIYDRLGQAEPVSEVSGFKVPGSQWRRYDQFDGFPEGLLVVGDALCSINPFFGQGMTLCAMQAHCLTRHLPRWLDGRCSTREIQSQFVPIIRASWDMATAEDMRFPQTAGERTLSTRIMHWYGAGLARASASSRLARQAQLEVIHLTKSPNRLLHPGIFARVLVDSLPTPGIFRRHAFARDT
ncbi:hypothetical protein WS62_06610 [Burkholderia sp. ABCPW 14]|nr:hypothetical protein WS62_06610 [Burkholderia sp. ABCPW 14]